MNYYGKHIKYMTTQILNIRIPARAIIYNNIVLQYVCILYYNIHPLFEISIYQQSISLDNF